MKKTIFSLAALLFSETEGIALDISDPVKVEKPTYPVLNKETPLEKCPASLSEEEIRRLFSATKLGLSSIFITKGTLKEEFSTPFTMIYTGESTELHIFHFCLYKRKKTAGFLGDDLEIKVRKEALNVK